MSPGMSSWYRAGSYVFFTLLYQLLTIYMQGSFVALLPGPQACWFFWVISSVLWLDSLPITAGQWISLMPHQNCCHSMLNDFFAFRMLFNNCVFFITRQIVIHTYYLYLLLHTSAKKLHHVSVFLHLCSFHPHLISSDSLTSYLTICIL